MRMSVSSGSHCQRVACASAPRSTGDAAPSSAASLDGSQGARSAERGDSWGAAASPGRRGGLSDGHGHGGPAWRQCDAVQCRSAGAGKLWMQGEPCTWARRRSTLQNARRRQAGLDYQPAHMICGTSTRPPSSVCSRFWGSPLAPALAPVSDSSPSKKRTCGNGAGGARLDTRLAATVRATSATPQEGCRQGPAAGGAPPAHHTTPAADYPP